MRIGSSPTAQRARRGALVALVFGAALLVASCVGEVLAGDSASSSQGSTGRAPDARRSDSGASTRVESPADRACPDDQARPFATGLSVVQVALYQAVKVPLYEAGEWLTERDAPVVQNKRALVRVFVQPLEGYEPHPVEGVLRIKNGDEVVEIVDEREFSAESSEDDLTTTFSFEIAPGRIKEGTQIAVSLEEPDCGAESGDPADVRVPKSGTKALRAKATGTLHVTLVPIQVEGRLANINAQQQANLRAALLAFYPVGDVQISMHAPVDFTGSASTADSRTLLAELLQTVKEQRAADKPAGEEYYFGIFQPSPSFRVYCEGGCVLGLAPQNVRALPRDNYGVGAYFADERGYETAVHELGHAHGRGHSPCDTGIVAEGIDPNYPRKDGNTGAWGWDYRTGKLLPPTNKDIMGYCTPTWISPYVYSLLAERSSAVNLPKPEASAQALLRTGNLRDRYRSLLRHEDGSARWGRGIETTPPEGESTPARVLDAQGNVVADIELVRTILGDTSAEFLSFPEPRAAWTAIEWMGHRIELSEVLPPL